LPPQYSWILVLIFMRLLYDRLSNTKTR
jgi:hypothetical protein